MNLEELLREERARPAPNPLAARTDQIVAEVRRRRRARAVAAGVAGLATAAAVVVGTSQLLGSPGVMSPAESAPVDPTGPTPLGPSPLPDSGWGRGGPYLGVDGVLHVGSGMQPEVLQIGAFTVVPSGVVYIDPTTSRVVWESWDRQTTVIGEAPWHVGGGDASWGGPSQKPWGGYRDVVGSATSDVVVWVEAAGDQRGDLVVVQPTTGTVLARTPIPGQPDRPVLIAGVDDETVHFATPFTSSELAASPSDVWSWRWATGEPPQPSQHGLGGGQVMDVSGGVWAMDNGRVLQFRNAAGTVLSEVPISYADRNHFGDGLSPDGRHWYSSAYNEFVVTATGDRVPAPAAQSAEPYLSARHGWAGLTSLTVIGQGDDGLTLCDAITGTCTEHLQIPSGAHYDLPAY